MMAMSFIPVMSTMPATFVPLNNSMGSAKGYGYWNSDTLTPSTIITTVPASNFSDWTSAEVACTARRMAAGSNSSLVKKSKSTDTRWPTCNARAVPPAKTGLYGWRALAMTGRRRAASGRRHSGCTGRLPAKPQVPEFPRAWRQPSRKRQDLRDHGAGITMLQPSHVLQIPHLADAFNNGRCIPGRIQRFRICVPKQAAQALRDTLLL